MYPSRNGNADGFRGFLAFISHFIADPCEHDNDSSGFIKGEEVLDHLNDY
jgi:hypothetical protein